MRRTSSERMLQSMIEAARGEPSPAVDTNLLEAQLKRKWFAQKSEHAESHSTRAHWFAVAVATLVLAVGAFAVYHRQSAPVRVAVNPLTPGTVNGDSLQTGASVTAGSSPVSVVHAGRARWVLTPHSVARIVSMRPCLTLVLEQGRIDADVVPKKESETFAIETRTHRVAVHGTQFSVTLEPSGVLVEVSSGVVVVSALAKGQSAELTRLTAPQRIRFPYFAPVPAMPTAPIVPQRAAVHGLPKGTSRQITADAPAPVESSSPQLQLPVNPPVIEQETALDFVRAAAERCFAQPTTDKREAESNVLVHLETQLSVTLAPAGNVREVAFSPPVPQAIQSCTFREIQGWAVSRSRDGARASRSIILAK